MRRVSKLIRITASDLSNHLACHHVTTLDLAVATGSKAAPSWHSPDAWVLQQRGIAHENAYIEHLTAQGLETADLRELLSENDARTAAVAAMERGVAVIVQPVLTHGQWFGRADVLRKVPGRRSAFGDWSYEVFDCKLALETKAGTVLQLALYSELLAELQGGLPEFMHVVAPNDTFAPESYRVSDFLAYHRYIKKRLDAAIQTNGDESSTSAFDNSTWPTLII